MRKSSRLNRINLNLLLTVLILIIGIGVFIVIKTPEREILSINGSIVMPAINYNYKDISAIDAKKLIEKNKNDPGFIIIDVSLNYDEGHIVNAVSYPINSLYYSIKSLDKNKTYLVYARNEIDSINAAKILGNNGFPKVYRLKGNYGAWVEMGYSITNSYGELPYL